MKLSRLLALYLLIITIASGLFAQQHHTLQSASLPTGIVDGAKNPELIPDSAAYRLYFITVSELPNALAEQKNRQRAHLGKIGLKDPDLEALIGTLETFKVHYADLTATYNTTAEAAGAAGGKPDINSFLSQRDALVPVSYTHLTLPTILRV